MVRPPADNAPRWLLLVHQIPSRPDYLRVKVGRRLQKVGAVALKSSVYVLPIADESREAFAWLAREIRDAGGEATVVEARFVDGLDDDAVEDRFRAARDEEYAPLVVELRAVLEALAEDSPHVRTEIARLARRLAEIGALDWFGATGRLEASGLLREIEARLAPVAQAPLPTEDRPCGRTWVTRERVGVDRMASAWLIRRFVDPEATFRFVPARGHVPVAGELRFDMFEAEYTHEGERCTFEVLAARFVPDDPALANLAELVHQLDVGDGGSPRPETAGLGLCVAAIAAAQPTDEARIARAVALFDDLYTHLGASLRD
jgi:hypothetical protein